MLKADRYFSPNLDQLYRDYCNKEKVLAEFMRTDRMTGCWLGEKDTADYIVIYFHGMLQAAIPRCSSEPGKQVVGLLWTQFQVI